MKAYLNRYLYLVLFMLLSSFANLSANNPTCNIEGSNGASILEKISNIHVSPNSFVFTTSKNNTKHNPLGDLTESEEIEEYEESLSSKKVRSKITVDYTFIFSFIFQDLSLNLQDNLKYYNNVVSKPKVKLHLKLQTFRI